MTQKLLAYQETDKRLKDIENKLNSSEEKKQMFIAYKYISGVSETIAKLDKSAEDLLNKFTGATLKQKELSEKLKEIADELNNVENEDEANYMLKKAEEISSSIKALETTVNKIVEAMNAIKAEYASIRQKTKLAQDQYKEYGDKFKELQDKFSKEVAEIKEKLTALRKGIDADLMAKYDAKRKDKIFPVLVALKGDKCGSCGMGLSMKDIADLESGAVVECDNCRTLVYKEK